MLSEVLVGTILFLCGIAIIIYGDKIIKSNDGAISKIFSHKQSNLKLIKWPAGIVLFLFGFISLQTQKSFYWAGLVEWLMSCSCLSIIGIKNSHWFSTGRSAFSELTGIDRKLVKLAGVLFGIGSFLFMIGALK
ncbi:hypothetical protein [Desulfobacter vibrioformis]|uniref:hypothetical protein n=1 Tax=Desulfobacter vibrioformis TaxID=34031 RepID=UPI00054EF036|nr:hypothetical protein [Desulfobacter vibrioformis]